MEGTEEINIVFLLITVVVLGPLFVLTTHNQNNPNKYLRIFPLLFMINAFVSFNSGKIDWWVFFIFIEAIVTSAVVLLLSFINKTKILNWIYFILFLFYIDAFTENNGNLFIFHFVSFFFPIFISLLMYLVLKKYEYNISIWGLAYNIKALTIMFNQWFFYQKPDNDVWYFMPFIVIFIFAIILCTWFILKKINKKKKEEEMRQAKENDHTRFMPGNG